MSETRRDRMHRHGIQGHGMHGHKAKQKSKSLYTFLIQSFIALFVIVLLILIILLAVNWLYSYNSVLRPKSYRIDDYSKELKAEKYQEIPVHKAFGKKGYIEVLDEDANVVYCSNPKIQTKYTKESMELITGIYDNTGYSIEKIGSSFGIEDGGTLLIQYAWNDDDQAKLLGFAVLDSERNVKYSTLSLNRKKLSQAELDFIRHSDASYDYRGIGISKYEFTTSKGEARTVLVHTESITMQMVQRSRFVTHVSAVVFLVSIVLAIALMGFHVMKRIKTPLRELQMAISEFGETEDGTDVSSSGVTEFTQVIASFRSMERKLREEEAKREALQTQRQQMLAGISHDMKTPITVIRGYVDAIRDGLVSPEEEDQYLKIIEEKATDMANLINSLSEYNNMEHPNFAYEFVTGNLTEYLREYIASKYQELSLMGYSIEADIPEEKVLVDFDHKHLKRVWENILGNSVRYTKPGTTLYVSLTAEAKAKDGSPLVVIEIGDDGPGLPKNIREQVFEPFVVAETARSNGQGSGLGLTVARDIILAHGGSICIEDREGKPGLFYRMELPRK